MTDPGFADRTYVEPLTVEVIEKIIAQERPDALLPTIGGQTGLNLAIDLAEAGVLDRYESNSSAPNSQRSRKQKIAICSKPRWKRLALICRAVDTRGRYKTPNRFVSRLACR